MAGEDDRGGRVADEERFAVVVERLARNELAHEGHQRRLGAALGGNVDERERRCREIWDVWHRRHNDLQMAERQPDPTPGLEPERGFVLAVLRQGVDPDDELGELAELARTAGVEPVGRLVQHRQQPDPRTYVGKGKLDEVKREYGNAGAEVLIVDDELAPSQQRLLENELKSRVVDRTQLILDIFAQHAVTAEGKLQVELAQLEYNLPRMRGMWQHLERLGGGVGTRGPGESQLETDRRIARRRISILRDRLEELSKQRDIRRKERKRTETPTVALAGYTNAGKSTLLNALTAAHVSVRDRLFETLDPTTRGFEHEGRRYLVTDTVGFVRRLPHQLVEGFAATLEETLVADLVLHVVDGSVPEERLVEQVAAVDAVLHEIGADELPIELVVNKVDAVDALRRRRLANRYPEALHVSALTGDGLEALRARIADRFARAVRAGAAAAPVRRGREAERALRARRADRAARGHDRGRPRRRTTAPSRDPPVRAVPRRRGDRRRSDAPRRVIELPILRLRDEAILPGRAYVGDAGLDLAACDRIELGPGERALVGTGLAVAVPEGYAGFVQPRSGLAARHGITIVNTPGLVDSGYRGELKVILANTDAHEAFVVEPGMRIAQLVVLPVPEVEPVEVDALPESAERGVHGFGSSA